MNTASFFNRRLFLACVGALLLLAAPVAVQAQINYTTNNGTITITGYTGPGGAVNIPATINGLPVTSIRDFAFGNTFSLTSVTIPNSVTNIGSYAFHDCDSLTNATIGSGVTHIGAWVFAACTSLTAITVAAQNLFYSSLNGVLFDKAQTKLIEFPRGIGGSYAIPNTVASIGDYAFLGCPILTGVTIPDSVTIIGNNVFEECASLTNISISASVTIIGNNVFEECASLTAITVDTNNPAYSSVNGVLFDKSKTMLIQCPEGIAGNYIIPDGVTAIGNDAFRNCASLTNVAIPNSVTNIGSYAFHGCDSLTNATIGSGVTHIGAWVFAACTSLTAITVAAQNLFYSSLNGVLFDKAQTKLIEFPRGIGGSYAIPNTVASIGDYAFLGCPILTGVTIPDSVTIIGDGAFESDYGLTTVTIGNGVTSIGHHAFGFCVRLMRVTIGSSVTSIGSYAFDFCRSLASITIPASVTNIEQWAFAESGLTSVYFKGNAPMADGTVFATPVFGNVYFATAYYLPGTTGWDDFSANTHIPAVLWKPLIQTGDGSFGVRSNQFGFNIAWASGHTATVEAATNLSNPIWTPVATNALTSGTSYFSDAAWTNFPQRFYRLTTP